MKDSGSASTIVIIITAILTLVFLPVIIFWFGYFGGWILSSFVGEHITQGVNLLLDRHSLEVDTIPVLCGTLAVIGRYFSSTQTNNNK